MERRAVRLLATASLAAALAACSSGSPSGGGSKAAGTAGGSTSSSAAASSGSSQKTVRIAFFNPVAANASTAAEQAGVMEAAKQFGAKVTVFDAKFDSNKQLSQIQDAIATKQYDAFVIMPLNGAALVDVTKQAISAGIKVVADWNNIGPDLSSITPQVPGLTAVVAQSMGNQGTTIGEQIVNACQGVDPCQAVYMPGTFNQGSEKLRLDAAKKVTGQHSNIKIKISADGGYQAGPAQSAASDVLLALPNVSVFATPGDQMVVGIVQALKDAGKLGKVKIISAGASKQGIQMVRNGVVMSDVIVLPKTEGYTSAKLAIQAVRGGQVPASVNSATLSPIGLVATKDSLSSGAGLKFTGEYDG